MTAELLSEGAPRGPRAGGRQAIKGGGGLANPPADTPPPLRTSENVPQGNNGIHCYDTSLKSISLCLLGAFDLYLAPLLCASRYQSCTSVPGMCLSTAGGGGGGLAPPPPPLHDQTTHPKPKEFSKSKE